MMNIDLTNIGIIERDTFRDCSSLKSVSVDDNSSTKVNSKNTIDKKFIKQQCDKGLLKNIVLSNSLTAIESNAFSGCISLESVEIPANVMRVGAEVFMNCENLETVVFKDNTTGASMGKIVGEAMFLNCKSLKTVVLSNDITAIGNNAFSGCKSLESVDIPANVVRIGTEVFMNCENLNTIIFKDNTTGASMRKIVGKSMFLNCKSLKTVVLSNDITAIGNNAFSGCKSLESVELPSNVIIIGENAFEKCENLEKVNFSGTSSKLVGRKIEAGAFSFCSSLNTITLPNNLELIEEQAFLDCTALEQIEIPENVKEIKDRAFYGCESLKTVVIIAKEPPLLGEGVFPIEGISFEVPKESIEKYKNENCWFQYKGMIQEA